MLQFQCGSILLHWDTTLLFVLLCGVLGGACWGGIQLHRFVGGRYLLHWDARHQTPALCVHAVRSAGSACWLGAYSTTGALVVGGRMRIGGHYLCTVGRTVL